MKNYICINGNKTELTEEQLKQLGIELPNANPFARADKYKEYYVIDWMGKVVPCTELKDNLDQMAFDSANYCTNREIMKQRVLHEALSRLLWRYSMEHDGNKINWECVSQSKWYVFYNTSSKKWSVGVGHNSFFLDTYFYTEKIAENAIEEIIKPFMAQHPEFKF